MEPRIQTSRIYPQSKPTEDASKIQDARLLQWARRKYAPFGAMCADANTGGRGHPAVTSAVHSLAGLWVDQGPDDGSRMKGDLPVRFCERLRLKRRGLLTFLQSLLVFA